MNKKLIICLWVLSAGAMAQEQIVTRDFSTTESKKNDFGLSFSLDAEKKLTSRMSLNFEGELRTQDNSSKVDRWTAGLGLQYKIYQTFDKRFNLKAGLGINYTRLQTLTEKSNFDKLSEHYDNEGNMRIWMPLTLFIDNGRIVAYDDEGRVVKTEETSVMGIAAGDEI